jgi:hypothetical protein
MQKRLDYRVTHRYSGLNISDSEVNRLLDIASWNEKVPAFPRPGRGAWHALDQEATLKADPALQFQAAKLKGVGLWNPSQPGRCTEGNNKLHDGEFSDAPIPPLTDELEYLMTYPHIGFNKEGEYAFVFSSPSPVGGILHERAYLEFWAAERLIDCGVPSIAPLAVIEYGQSLQFKGKPMGAVITLSPEIAPYRISEVLFGSALTRGSDPGFDRYYDKMREALNIAGDPEDEAVRLQVICALARQAGKLIHDFSMTGMYRYSGDWGNFVYCVKRKELFLIDLDSIQDMESIAQPLRSLQAWRDLASSVYRMIAKIAYPTALDKYTLNNLMAHDPVHAFISGYFPDLPNVEIRAVSQRLWNYFIPHLFLIKKHRDAIRSEWSSDRRKTYKMDYDLFYILALTSLQPLLAKSDIGQKYPSQPTREEMWRKAERFLGERFEYFVYLMGEPQTLN